MCLVQETGAFVRLDKSSVKDVIEIARFAFLQLSTKCGGRELGQGEHRPTSNRPAHSLIQGSSPVSQRTTGALLSSGMQGLHLLSELR